MRLHNLVSSWMIINKSENVFVQDITKNWSFDGKRLFHNYSEWMIIYSIKGQVAVRFESPKQ